MFVQQVAFQAQCGTLCAINIGVGHGLIFRQPKVMFAIRRLLLMSALSAGVCRGKTCRREEFVDILSDMTVNLGVTKTDSGAAAAAWKEK